MDSLLSRQNLKKETRGLKEVRYKTVIPAGTTIPYKNVSWIKNLVNSTKKSHVKWDKFEK